MANITPVQSTYVDEYTATTSDGNIQWCTTDTSLASECASSFWSGCTSNTLYAPGTTTDWYVVATIRSVYILREKKTLFADPCM
jgi:hypothetical protein